MSNGPQVKNLQHCSSENITEMPQNVNPVDKLEDASNPGGTCSVLVGFHGGRRRSVKCCKRMLFGGTLSPRIWIQAHNSISLPVVQSRETTHTSRHDWQCFSMVDSGNFSVPKTKLVREKKKKKKKGEILKLTSQSASLQNMPSVTKNHETQNPKRHTANKSQRVSSKKNNTFAKL